MYSRITNDPVKAFVTDGKLVWQIRTPHGWTLVAAHRFIAKEFFDIDLDRYQVVHVDGNRQNNEITNFRFVERNSAENQKRPIQIYNLDTDETYPSLQIAGLKLGYLGKLKVPAEAMESGSVFERRGYRLKVV
jgi:hypothetical protein